MMRHEMAREVERIVVTLEVPLNIVSAGESIPVPDTYALIATRRSALVAAASTRWSSARILWS